MLYETKPNTIDPQIVVPIKVNKRIVIYILDDNKLSVLIYHSVIDLSILDTECNVPRDLRAFVSRSAMSLGTASKPSDSKTHDLA